MAGRTSDAATAVPRCVSLAGGVEVDVPRPPPFDGAVAVLASRADLDPNASCNWRAAHALWASLSGRRVLNAAVLLWGFGDTSCVEPPPTFDAETVFVSHCDKNFVYSYLRPAVFPRVRTIYMLTAGVCDGVPMVWSEWSDEGRGDVAPPSVYLAPGDRAWAGAAPVLDPPPPVPARREALRFAE